MRMTNNKIIVFLICLILIVQNTKAQVKYVLGFVKDKSTNKAISGIAIRNQNSNKTTITDTLGNFTFYLDCTICSFEIKPSLTYKSLLISDIDISKSDKPYIEIELESQVKTLNEVVINGANFNKTIESPLSLRSLSASEIERMPGGLQDISRVLQSFPGISIPPAWRNDLIVRGGSSYENKFFLDDIPIPNINHFTPQGSSGGAYGIINPEYLKNLDFYAAAFPSNKGNALSSILDFKLKNGNPTKRNVGVVASGTDLSITSDGFISKTTTYLSSFRLSNWKSTSLFLGLPVLPKYSDFLVKIRIQPTPKNEITIIGLGNIDQAEPNLRIREGVFFNKNDQELTSTIDTYLSQVGFSNQYSFTFGGIYKRYFTNGNLSVSLSGYDSYNALKNYTNQTDKIGMFINYDSHENQSTLKFNFNKDLNYRIKWNAGLTVDNIKFRANSFTVLPISNRIDTVSFTSKFNTQTIAFNCQINYSLSKLDLSAGLRIDMATYNGVVSNPINQVSPRISLAYRLSDKFSLNASNGFYTQLPLSNLLGFKDENGEMKNCTLLKYMKCWQSVIGLDYFTSTNLKLSVEFFLKKYYDIPYLINESLPLPNSISFVNLSPIGLSPAISTSKGRSFGLELLLHQKLWKNMYGIIAYTLMKSEYSNMSNLIPSNWDYRHIFSATLGKRFSKRWEIGIKLRFNSGGPYTPLDYNLTSNKLAYDINPLGILNINKLNSERLPNFFATDLRIEKRYNFTKWHMTVFTDIQNVFNSSISVPPFYRKKLDNNGNELYSSDGTKYLLSLTTFKPPFNILPTFGIKLNF